MMTQQKGSVHTDGNTGLAPPAFARKGRQAHLASLMVGTEAQGREATFSGLEVLVHLGNHKRIC